MNCIIKFPCPSACILCTLMSIFCFGHLIIKLLHSNQRGLYMFNAASPREICPNPSHVASLGPEGTRPPLRQIPAPSKIFASPKFSQHIYKIL